MVIPTTKPLEMPNEVHQTNLIQGRQCRSIDLHGDRLALSEAETPVANGLYVTSHLEWKRVTHVTAA
jgi:hypothetical protein